jgi:hypothetical protein
MSRRCILLPVASTFVLLGLLGCRDRRVAPAVEDDPPPAAAGAGKRALLVGVTKHDHGYRPLHGPDRDVHLFHRVLMTTFGFPAQNIVALTERDTDAGRPTRANIHRAFRDLARQAGPGDEVAILLAGHGSEQPDQVPPDPDDPEPNGMDQVFLPADAEQPDRRRKVIPGGIIDDELRLWLKAITDRGARVFLVADCCHAGTLLRGQAEDGVRGIPAEQLWPPEVLEEARKNGTRASGSQRGVGHTPSPFKLEKAAALVALYACQPEQKTYEFPLPDREGEKHGLLTWTVCQLLSQSASRLTYRELARQVHQSIVRYYEESARAREAMPIPFAEGDDLDREVLGARTWPGRSHLVLRREGQLSITGGKLHGLYPGTILAVHPPAGSAEPNGLLGHVCITRSDTFTAHVEPCAHAGIDARADLPDGARVQPVYLVHDLNALRVYLADPDADRLLVSGVGVPLGDRSALVTWARRPEEATWAIRAFAGKLWLLPAAADVREPASCRFELPREDLAAALRSRLLQIARGQNLLCLASTLACEPARDVDVEAEIRKLRDETDPDGVVVSGTGRALELRGGEWVRFRIHNRGKSPADVTALAVFSDFSVHAFFPEKSGEINNRVPPGAWVQSAALQMNTITVGLEHVVVIAVAGAGRQQIDFACLAEDTWEAARGARTRGPNSLPILETPLGQLFAHALFRHGLTRGSRAVERCRMRLLSWHTLPASHP